MEEQFKLIEGTLARTKERKNTILYQQAKRAEEKNRLAKLGITEIPTDPSKVNDINVIKFALFKIKQQLGEKKVLINNEDKMNISKVGEAQLRAANNSINKLVRKQYEWEKRMDELLGKEATEDYSFPSFIFFGCARSLPEAKKVEGKNNGRSSNALEEYASSNEQKVESEDDSSISSNSDPDNELRTNSTYQDMISRLLVGDNSLLKAEKETEKKFRHSLAFPQQRMKLESELVLNFDDEKNKILSEDFYKKRLMDKRKESLKARLADLKN